MRGAYLRYLDAFRTLFETSWRHASVFSSKKIKHINILKQSKNVRKICFYIIDDVLGYENQHFFDMINEHRSEIQLYVHLNR